MSDLPLRLFASDNSRFRDNRTVFPLGGMSILSEREIRSVEDGSPEYRQINGLAILGVLLGGASILALSHPAFWGIPLIAAGLNWRALRQIHSQPEALKGRTAALLGMALSLIFGLTAPLLAIGQEIGNRRQAIEVARG